MNFFEELKRRNVFRVGIAYAVVGWLIMQVTDTFSPALRLPDWFPSAVAFLLLIGLPLALFLAWAFELTPDGIKRESEVDPNRSVEPQKARKLDRMIIVALVAVVGVLLVDRYMGESEKGSELISESGVELAIEDDLQIRALPPFHDGKTSVAVLPFVNMSDDAQNEYFSDGISEELLNVLVRIKELRVPSRTSSFIFKGSDKNVTQIGRELQVDHVLEGSVRKAGNQIRVTAQLIEVKTDTHLWSDTYTRELDDIFAIQDEIAQAIIAALKLTLSVGDQQKITNHSTDNVEAYNKYLLGRHLWNQRTTQSLPASVKPLREAVAMDPEFDQAWSALADTYVMFPEYDAGTVRTSIPLSREAADRALAINPDSARALTSSAYRKGKYEYDWEGSNLDFQRAIELEPGYATAYQWYGNSLATQGNLEEALVMFERAAAADPLSAVIHHSPGFILVYSNRPDEAEEILLSTIELDPHFFFTYKNLDFLYTIRGDYEAAREHAMEYARLRDFDPAPDIARIDAIENPTLLPRALELLEQRQDTTDGVFGKGLQYALLGEFDLALDNLEKAVVDGDPYATGINWVRIYDPLRDNPRFQAMLRKMNLLP